jgi:hypothetical protein
MGRGIGIGGGPKVPVPVGRSGGGGGGGGGGRGGGGYAAVPWRSKVEGFTGTYRCASGYGYGVFLAYARLLLLLLLLAAVAEVAVVSVVWAIWGRWATVGSGTLLPRAFQDTCKERERGERGEGRERVRERAKGSGREASATWEVDAPMVPALYPLPW